MKTIVFLLGLFALTQAKFLTYEEDVLTKYLNNTSETIISSLKDGGNHQNSWVSTWNKDITILTTNKYILSVSHGELMLWDNARSTYIFDSTKTGARTDSKKGSGPFTLVLQDDDNIALYGTGGAYWALMTNGACSAACDSHFFVINGNLQYWCATGTSSRMCYQS